MTNSQQIGRMAGVRHVLEVYLSSDELGADVRLTIRSERPGFEIKAPPTVGSLIQLLPECEGLLRKSDDWRVMSDGEIEQYLGDQRASQ
jgi:hypothetical protein